MKRFRPAVAILSVTGLLAAASFAAGESRAADGSLSDTVTGAFETIVIDARTVAGKAATAAKQAIAPAERKSSRSKKKKPDEDQKDAGQNNAGQNNAGKPAPDAAKASVAAEAKDTRNAKPGETSGAGKEPDANASTATTTATKADDKKDAAGAANAKTEPGDGKPQEPGKAAAAPPKKPAIPTEWPAVDVELAKARCTQLLKGIDAVVVPEPPFRKGDCGAMAPVRLISLGKSPEVAISPPAVVSCDMVVALSKWMKGDVQPLARRHLGAEVIRIETMSDYSCRMAYGRIGNKLSEHGKANALDIRSFTTRKGEEAVVLTGWGATKRDIEKQIAAAKAAAAKAEIARIASEKASKEQAEAATAAAQSATTATPLPRKTLVEGLPPREGDTNSLSRPATFATESFGMAPARLGGPKEAVVTNVEIKPVGGKSKKKKTDAAESAAKPDETAALPPGGAGGDQPAVAPPPKNPTGRFLHEVHAAGCRIFGTTLGPEANEAHRNHFHVDMAPRKVKKICD